LEQVTYNNNKNKKIISEWPFRFSMRTVKKDDFSLCERMFVGPLRLAWNLSPALRVGFSYGSLALSRL
jgi:hypothetical protein